MSAVSPRFRFSRGALVLATTLVFIPGSFALAEPVSEAARREHVRTLKQLQVDLMRQGARRRLESARRYQVEVRKARRAGQPAPAPGTRLRKAPEDIDPPAMGSSGAGAPRLSANAAAVIPANVRVNDPSLDAPGSGQAEEAVAALGSNLLVAWNDGQGFVPNPDTDTQGFAWSTDGGATWADGGAPPDPPGFPSWVWTSDPVVTVNEKTGDFYYCGLASSSATTNAIGVARGHFGGGGFVWDAAVSVRSVANASAFLDKQWMVADSATSNLYLTNTTFTASNQIDYYRSTDNGATWSAPSVLSAPSDAGLIQGSRPVVGPGGEVYVTWSALGLFTEQDFFRFRKSPAGSGGAPGTFGAQVSVTGFIANFGTGAPGFNRERAIHFPSIAVDRTTGVNRGRIYVAWNESYNHMNDMFAASPAHLEVEPNDAPGTATPFPVGNILRGSTSSVNPADLDYFSFTLNAGEHIILYADSLPPSQTYTLRLFAPDGSQRLCFGGDLSAGSVTTAFYTFTAPVSGTYFVRMAPAFTTSVTGGYRVRTRYGASGGDRGRDQRDVFLSWSDDGATWATPVRVNDDAVGFDDWLPEVQVGADGCPYVTWFDWRDDPHGSRTHQYIARSTDGGASWTNRRFTSAQANFTTTGSNIAPNQGDYSHLASGGRFLHPVWADGRGSDVDVWTAAVDTDFQLGGCPLDQAALAGSSVPVSLWVTNLSPLFANEYLHSVTSQRNWPVPSPGSIPVAETATGPIGLLIAVPDSAASGVNRICVRVSNARASVARTCCFDLSVTGTTGVADGPTTLLLGPATPNPGVGSTRLAFTLPSGGRVRLAIYGLRGERVRTLVDGERAAGAHTATWDGRDDSGRAVRGGTYFARLEAAGRSTVRRLVWMR
jgi:hypothetical protein